MLSRPLFLLLSGLLCCFSAFAQQNPSAASSVNLKKCCKVDLKAAKKGDGKAYLRLGRAYAGKGWWSDNRDYKSALDQFEKGLKKTSSDLQTEHDLFMIYYFGGYGVKADSQEAQKWLDAYSDHDKSKRLFPDRLDADISQIDRYRKKAEESSDVHDKLRYAGLLLEQHLSYPIAQSWLDLAHKESDHLDADFLKDRWATLKKEQKNTPLECITVIKPVFEKHIKLGSAMARLEYAYMNQDRVSANETRRMLLPILKSHTANEIKYKALSLLAKTQRGKYRLAAHRQLYILRQQHSELPDYDFTKSILTEYSQFEGELKGLRGLAKVMGHYKVVDPEVNDKVILHDLNGNYKELLTLSTQLGYEENVLMYGQDHLQDYRDELHEKFVDAISHLKKVNYLLDVTRWIDSLAYQKMVTPAQMRRYESVLDNRLKDILAYTTDLKILLDDHELLEKTNTSFFKDNSRKDTYEDIIRGDLAHAIDQVKDPATLYRKLHRFQENKYFRDLYPEWEGHFKRRIQKLIPNKQDRNFWMENDSLSRVKLTSIFEAKAFYDRIGTESLRPEQRNQLTSTLQKRTLDQFFPTLESLKKAPDWLNPELRSRLSGKIFPELKEKAHKIQVKTLMEGKKYVREVENDPRLLDKEKDQLVRITRAQIVKSVYGYEATRDEIRELESKLKRPEYAWLLPDAKDVILLYLNNQEDFFTGIHPNQKNTITYNYKVYKDPKADRFIDLTKSCDEGYILEIFCIKNGFNQKILHTLIGTKRSEGVISIRLYYPEKRSYSWKPRYDSYFGCEYRDDFTEIQVKSTGKMLGYYNKYHDFEEATLKAKVQPQDISPKTAIRTALQYFIFAYEPLLDK
ncbi:MAG: hypothetical protein AAF740_01940 [Bacteroidota bacterium]